MGCTAVPHPDPHRAPLRAEPAAVGVDEIPARPDAAYAQRVMDTLDEVEGDAIRALVQRRGADAEFENRIRAIYAGPGYDTVEAGYRRDQDEGLQTVFRRQPLNPVTRIDQVLWATPACLFLAVHHDLGPALVREPPPESTVGYSVLRPRPTGSGGGVDQLNPTAWIIIASGPATAGTPPANPCR